VNIGFTLRELTLSGPDKRDAVVTFEPGLNVITGPSDTGKTYIFQCLDYIMGRSTPPKTIPEAEGYDTIRLSLRDRTGGEHILVRSLRGGGVRLSSPNIKDRVLKAKHTADDPNTVSAFLLQLSGLAGKRVRTNASGTTRPLSFRDLAQFALVDEESIMTARSPALSGQYTAATVESRIFRLLLTGEDDSSVIAADDPKVARGRRTGQVELLQTLIARARVAHQDDEIPETIDAAAHNLATLRAKADDASAALAEHQGAATEVEERRRAAWTELRTVQSRADVLRELQNRFELLEQQYKSDLRRLDAIAEAGLRLEQMTEERCPVCGALAEHHQHTHAEEQVSPSDIRASCQAEASKITTLLHDLRSTQGANAAELDELVFRRNARAADLSGIDAELGDALRPKVAEAAQAFRNAEAQRQRAERALELLQRERELQELLEDAPLQAAAQRDKHPASTVSTGEADAFARVAESLLRAWHFPDLDRVAFSEADQDLVISGRARGSHGKGVRAITHAVFVLALLRHSLDADLPFPGMVVIDSPLVVYREPDPEEGTFPIALKDYFYKSIAETFEDAQVLILENDAPQAALDGEANIITFTKTASGRYGFIPKP
jgi:hypothetical protein